MEERAIFSVVIGGSDITPTISPLVNSIRISDAAGTHSDTCSIEIDDTDGRVVLPRVGVMMTVSLGWQGSSAQQVFTGKVDDVRCSGSRSGRTISVTAKGLDTLGKAKQHQRKHIDNQNVEGALKKAGEAAGITSIKVDPSFASITRDYWSLDGESFIAFGERVAREIGGTFKVQGNKAVMAKKGSGKSPSGQTLPTVIAKWGENLISYDITPSTGRPRFKKVRARYYDPKKAKWVETEAEVDGEDLAEAAHTHPKSRADEAEAKSANDQDKGESKNQKGGGSISINGNATATPEGSVVLVGARPGVDGTYRIETVQHEYSRSGWTTQLSVKLPEGEAGKDTRK
jgi:uncharacterized protein